MILLIIESIKCLYYCLYRGIYFHKTNPIFNSLVCFTNIIRFCMFSTTKHSIKTDLMKLDHAALVFTEINTIVSY